MDTVDGQTSPAEATEPSAPRGGWLAAGSLLGALAASACCLLPFTLAGLGVGVAWMAPLGFLAAYEGPIRVAALGLLALGFARAYARPAVACVDGACATSRSIRLVRGTLWTATALFGLAVAFPFLLPYLPPV